MGGITKFAPLSASSPPPRSPLRRSRTFPTPPSASTTTGATLTTSLACTTPCAKKYRPYERRSTMCVRCWCGMERGGSADGRNASASCWRGVRGGSECLGGERRDADGLEQLDDVLEDGAACFEGDRPGRTSRFDEQLAYDSGRSTATDCVHSRAGSSRCYERARSPKLTSVAGPSAIDGFQSEERRGVEVDAGDGGSA